MRRSRRKTLAVVVFSVLLAGSAALNVVLGRQKVTLVERNRLLVERLTQARPGLVVPEYPVETLAGERITLGRATSRERQLLFFFTTTCEYCLASLPAWKALAAEADRLDGVTVVGVGLDSAHLVQRYRDEHDLRFPITTLEDLRYAALFRATRVPLTVVIGEPGQVLYGRTGELSSEAAVDSVLAALRSPPSADGADSVLRRREPPPASSSGMLNDTT